MCSSLFHIFWHCAVKSLSPLSYQEYKYVWKCHYIIIGLLGRCSSHIHVVKKLLWTYSMAGISFHSSINMDLVGGVKACWRCIPSILPSLETRDPTFLLLLGNAILHNPSFFSWTLHLSCPHAKHCVQHYLRERNLTTCSQGAGEHKPAAITPLLLVT